MFATVLLWTIIGFIAGALPFSVWLGRLATRRDIRQFGDGNPGAANAVRAGGWRIGLPAVILDGLKGAIPVGVAYHAFGIAGWGLVPVVLAPVFGHAFSPFLGFRGGKAIATTFGVWTGLTIPYGPFVLGSLLAAFFYTVSPTGWAVMLTMGAWLLYLLTLQPVLSAQIPGPDVAGAVADERPDPRGVGHQRCAAGVEASCGSATAAAPEIKGSEARPNGMIAPFLCRHHSSPVSAS